MKDKSPILQMYYGERGQMDGLKVTKEESDALNEVVKYDEEIRKKLSPELLELYEKTIRSIENLNEISASTYYAEGFRFGVLIGLDVLSES